APADLAPAGLAPAGLAPAGLAPAGLAPAGLAPAGPSRPSPEPVDRPKTIDSSFVSEQNGFMALPVAELGRRVGRAPVDLVIVFISKFDLVSNALPTQDVAARDAMRSLFNDHVQQVEVACRENGVPIKIILGSATKGWGVADLDAAVRRLFSTRK